VARSAWFRIPDDEFFAHRFFGERQNLAREFDSSQLPNWMLGNRQTVERGKKNEPVEDGTPNSSVGSDPGFPGDVHQRGPDEAVNPQGMGPWPDGLPQRGAFEIWPWIRDVSFLNE